MDAVSDTPLTARGMRGLPRFTTRHRRSPRDKGADNPAPATHVLTNLTGRRIAIMPLPGRPEEPLIIPPFGQRAIPASELESYDYKSWARQMLVKADPPALSKDPGSSAIDLCPTIAGYSLLAALTLLTVWEIQGRGRVYGILALAATALTVTAWLFGWIFGHNVGETWHRIGRSTNIFLVVLIGFGIPFLATAILDQDIQGSTHRQVFKLSGVVLLMVLSTASILPGALYYWFHRQKMPVLRENFLRDVVRLDPNVQTITDAETSYSGLIDDVYGAAPVGSPAVGSARATTASWGGTPILIITLVFAGLWSWTLLAGVVHREDGVVLRRQAAAAAAGKPSEIASQDINSILAAVPGYSEAPPDNLSLLVPNNDVVTWAFLGSYFFALNMLFRRYARSDLSPKAYTHVCVRTFTAIVVAWALSNAPFLQTASGRPNSLMLLLAFMIGIVPETGTAIIQDILQSSEALGNKIPSIQEDHPLSKLDGISLYDRSQLLEVGIENVESLAHNNLVDLMLWTRIPTSRLVDFVDQAVLYLHVQGPADLHTTERSAGDDAARELLSRYGIRTATDLERAFDLATNQDEFLSLLDGPGARVRRLQVILDALEDDEWMVYLRNWRSQSLVGAPISTVEEFVAAASAGARASSATTGRSRRHAQADRDRINIAMAMLATTAPNSAASVGEPAGATSSGNGAGPELADSPMRPR